MTVSVNGTALAQYLQAHDVSPADVRCRCGRLLMRARLIRGSVVQVRCPKCNRMNSVDEVYHIATDETALQS